MPGLHRAIEACDVHQRSKPRPRPAAQDRQPLPHEGAVEALQRHDIGDRRQCDEVERGQQIGLAALPRPKVLTAQLAAGRNQRQEDDAGGAEMAQPREIVLPVGIDQRCDRRQPLGRLMVVEHDDVEPERVASASGSWLVVPQSTVTSSVAPSSASMRIASLLGP
jgi:hypothetical protein